MIAPELRTRIRRLFFAEHWRVGTIAAELGLHHDTFRRAIEADRFIRPDALVRPSMLDPYKAFLAETLEQHPRLRATRLFEMARDRGYRGSVVQLRRHVATIRPAPRTEAYLRLQTLPAEQAQVVRPENNEATGMTGVTRSASGGRELAVGAGEAG